MGLMRTRPDLCLTFVRHLVEQQRRTLTRLEALMHIRAGPRLLVSCLIWPSGAANKRGTVTRCLRP